MRVGFVWLHKCAVVLLLSLASCFSTPVAAQISDFHSSNRVPNAQIVQVANRLPEEIDSSPSKVLHDHHPTWAIRENSLGPKLGEMALTIVLSRSQEQQLALGQLLSDQQNPLSPDYHHWLTPSEFGDRFGISESDISAITVWLQSQGLHVSWVPPSRTYIGLSGRAEAIGRTFHTQVNNYSVHGITRFSVASDPAIPVVLAPIIKAIQGLYTIEEHPAHHMLPAQSTSPNATTSNGSHFITPEDFQRIYDYTDSYDGSGQTIGIVGRSRTNSADFANYMQVLNIGFHVPTEVVPTAFGGVDPGPPLTAPPGSGFSFGDQGEATLDVLRAASTAPGANILLVVATAASGGIGVDAQYLIQTTPLPAQIMTISFGGCESGAGPASVNYFNTLFEQAAAEGISVFVSSGDSGASGCDADFALPPIAPSPNSPNFLCSSSFATCVGGTEFNDASSPTLYWSSSNDTHFGSALGYIPEGGWNEPVAGTTTQVASSGGGVSSYVSTPTWQTGTGVPSARAGRYTPDISFSSSCHDGYFACFAAGGGSCGIQSNGTFSFVYFCGTSAAAPSMAGVTALLNQKLGFAQGDLNPEIYSLASKASTSFHDATVSSSGVSGCSVFTPSMCNNSIPGPTSLAGGQAGYLVTTGYDLVTGLGSLDISKFLAAFANPFIAPTVTVTPSATSILATQPLSVTVSVNGSGSNPPPTGAVSLTVENYISPPVSLVNGSATIVIPADSLYWSIDTTAIIAQYFPDDASVSTYRTLTGSTFIVINPVIPTVTLFLSSNNITTAQNLGVTVQASGGTGNPTVSGQVDVTAIFPSSIGSYSVYGNLSSGSVTLNIPAGILPPGVSSINALYTPEGQSGQFYNQTFSANSPSVTVTAGPKSTPTISVAPSAPSITTAQSLGVTVTVTPSAGKPAPTGTITLNSGSYSPRELSLVGGAATFTIPAGTLPVGSNTITAAYLGDFNFNASNGTSSVTVVALTKTTPTITVTPSSSSVASGQSLDVSVSVTVPTGYPVPTGSLTLESGNFSIPVFISNGSGTVTIPSGSLSAGSDTLTVTYAPDQSLTSVFNNATGSATVTVTASVYSMTATPVTLSPGQSGSSTVTVSSSNDYSGIVALTCAITSSPSGAKDAPTCAATQAATLNSTTQSITGTVTVHTTPVTSALVSPNRNQNGFERVAGGTILALILLGLPRRRRFLRLILAVCFLVNVMGLIACGGGGGTPSNHVTDPGTTPGTYSITVSGTGNDSGKTTASTTFTLNVN
jgi:Pro-kumamolisin, activation domain/Bacterial Ig-like domain (group 3)